MLKFSFRNMKLNLLSSRLGVKKTEVIAFDIPAGFTCPAARICQTYSDRKTGKITRGKFNEVDCYAALVEARYKNTREAHWYNLDLLKSVCKVGKRVVWNSEYMTLLILESLPKTAKFVRIHSSGDYFAPEYFQAWVTVAKIRTDTIFFGYTKVLEYVQADKPDNFSLQYSYGGTHDSEFDALTDKPAACYIGQYDNQYPFKVVCGSHETAHEDYFAIRNRETFVIGEH